MYCISVPFYLLHIRLPRGLLPQSLCVSNLHMFHGCHRATYMPPSNLWFNYLHNTTTKPAISSYISHLLSCMLVSVLLKYSNQHVVFKQFISLFFLEETRQQVSHPYKMMDKLSLIYFNLTTFRKKTRERILNWITAFHDFNLYLISLWTLFQFFNIIPLNFTISVMAGTE